jgi:hypothetical protein
MFRMISNVYLHYIKFWQLIIVFFIFFIYRQLIIVFYIYLQLIIVYVKVIFVLNMFLFEMFSSFIAITTDFAIR